MSYTLVIKHNGKWQAFYTNARMSSVKAERERLLNTEYPPICYIIKTDEAVESVTDTVGRFVHAMEYGDAH